MTAWFSLHFVNFIIFAIVYEGDCKKYFESFIVNSGGCFRRPEGINDIADEWEEEGEADETGVEGDVHVRTEQVQIWRPSWYPQI